MSGDLLVALADGVARVTLNRPHARNALTFAMYQRLGEACTAAAADPAIRVMVITGAGDKAFAAGTDIAEFRQFQTAADALAYEERIEAILSGLERLRMPVIAAIAGACTGGGAAIAAACDLRIATRDARFGFPIARTLGNCLSIRNLARLSSLVGPARVKDMLLTARLVDAQEAQAIGLVHEVVEDHAALAARVEALAATIGGHAPLTIRATKEALYRLQAEAAAPSDADLVTLCYMSEDFREGMEAFLAKRPPFWRGR